MPAHAVIMDGIKTGADGYVLSFDAGWYNGHATDTTKYVKDNPLNETTVYWQHSGTDLFLYLEAPLEAKNMIWGTGVTLAEAELYFQQYSHHDKPGDPATAAEWLAAGKNDFGTMTGSEKVEFWTADGKKIVGDLADAEKNKNEWGEILLAGYQDSVDYILGHNGSGEQFEGCDETNCDASDTPMSFEFWFTGVSIEERNMLLGGIETNDIAFHLSPERGGVVPVPEPATMFLLGTGLVGLAIPRIRKKFKKIIS